LQVFLQTNLNGNLPTLLPQLLEPIIDQVMSTPTDVPYEILIKAGVYGRLDKNGFFPTTVTNMDPTAKQSQVLHPSVCYLSELYIYLR
jgi:hypothetical protein